MQSLPLPLAPLGAFRQFVAYRLEPSRARPGKIDKIPLDASGNPAGASGPETMCGFDEAKARAARHGHGVGFTFTAADPFFFLDIDGALQPDGTWSPLAAELCGLFPDAAVEVSQSGRGLHVIGSGVCPEHGCRNQAAGLELYTESRFVALTGHGIRGSAAADCREGLSAAVPRWFPPTAYASAEWTEGPVRGGVADDADLLAKAMRSQSAAAAFSGKASFADLWSGDEAALARAFPDPDRPYDASAADAALAQHLAFWTGGDCERIARLMRESGLDRDKYEREDYLPRTVSRAASLQTTYYEPAPEVGDVAKLTGTPKEIEWAERLRAEKLASLPAGPDRDNLASKRSARFWIDNQARPVEEIAAANRPMAAPKALLTASVERKEGHQVMPPDLQESHFAGCVYVQAWDCVLAGNGARLKQGQFNATYGGYEFTIDGQSGKTTDSAWKAFTESRCLRWPIAEASCFRPSLPFGSFATIEGHRHVNIYRPVPIRKLRGDPGPFLRHLGLLLPDPQDRAVALAYMAACVQRMGVKFQWAPLFQGVEGNGKTLLTRCVAYAVGEKYTHYPDAEDLANKFNSWLVGNVLIGVEDVYVPEHRADVMNSLKPKITNSRQGIQGKGDNQVSDEVCANFMLNSNHRDAIRKSVSDRRFAIFFTAQQTPEDLKRDGMSGDYFPALYGWLKGTHDEAGRPLAETDEGRGYAIVAQLLEDYEIPYALDPAGGADRAPRTSSTDEAVTASLGRVEQEVIEAIEEELPGFRGGWVSSMALDRLLQSRRMGGLVPRNRRKEMLETLGYAWHPSLNQGRADNMLPSEGGKPRLFARVGHEAAMPGRPRDVVERYVSAQGYASNVTQFEAKGA